MHVCVDTLAPKQDKRRPINTLPISMASPTASTRAQRRGAMVPRDSVCLHALSTPGTLLIRLSLPSPPSTRPPSLPFPLP